MDTDINNYDKCFILTADIDMEGQVFTMAIIAADIDSLNGGFQGTAFTGTFDGNGHKVTHFTIVKSGSNWYFGLFGKIDIGGSVKNLGLENCSVSGSSYSSWYVGGLVGNNNGNIINCYSRGAVSGSSCVGGLVGLNDSGSISNCYSTGAVSDTSGSSGVGGLVGVNNYGSISNCYATGAVISGDDFCVGGLVGDNYSGSISNCYSTGTVSGPWYVGGLVGGNNYSGSISNCYSTSAISGSVGSSNIGGLVGGNAGSVSNCYSTGAVSGTQYVGGLVGGNDYSGNISNCYSSGSVSGSSIYYIGGLVGLNHGNISNCYSRGAVSGSSIYIGGLVGANYGGSVSSSFWDTDTSGQTTSAGGTGKATAEMKTKSTFTDVGWDFTTIWGIYDGISYPWLSPIIISTTPPPNPGDALWPVNPITTPPDGNLKRWDGQSWQPITSWNDPHIHIDRPTVVIAHGWKTADGNSNLFASDSKISEIAKTLYLQDSSANILAWDWQNQAVSNPGGPLLKAFEDIQQEGLRGAAESARRGGEQQGKLLANELKGLHIGNDKLQLIGHSNGGAVIGAAASELALSGQKVKRITTLDTPNLYLGEPPLTVLLSSLRRWWNPPYRIDSNLLSTGVNAMQYVKADSALQVEVYYSALEEGRNAFGFGFLLSHSNDNNVFNGMIYPGNVTNPFDSNQYDHFRIIDWYCGKDRTPLSPEPGQFIAGLNWSILSTDSNDFNVGTYAEQSFNSGVFGQFTSAQTPPLTPKKIWWDNFDTVSDVISNATRNWFAQHVEIFMRDIRNFAVKIMSGSDGYLWQDMSIPQDASYLTFDMKVETPEAGDFLTVSIGDEVIYYKSLNTADSNFWTVDPIFIGDFAGQTETLLFALNHVGDGTPSILIDNVTFSATNFPPRPITVDLNNDGIPNFHDFSIFANFWQNSSCSEPNWCNGSDFDKNGTVDIHDLQVFAEFWLWPVADLDLDRGVDFVDFNIFTNQWLDDCNSPDWCYGSDINKSGSVNFVDFAIFAKHWLEGF